jgi:peptidoglycan/xylan/chitin deacetylase (PgdA/CDA1 family)
MKNKSLKFSILLLGLAIFGCKPAEKHSTQAVVESAKERKENSTSEIRAKQEVPILCYHRIAEDPSGDYALSPTAFADQLKALADSGFHSISPDELYNYLVYNDTLPPHPFMITFDDSRSEHATIAAPLLERYGFKGVFFIMTITYGKKNYMTTQQIAELAKAGHTIGLHTWDHTMVSKFKDSTDWQRQIEKPLAKLAILTGKPVAYFAYPNGVYNHEGASGLSNYFKLSFILSNKRDSLVPLQTVRRMIVPGWSAKSTIQAMRRTFKLN